MIADLAASIRIAAPPVLGAALCGLSAVDLQLFAAAAVLGALFGRLTARARLGR